MHFPLLFAHVIAQTSSATPSDAELGVFGKMIALFLGVLVLAQLISFGISSKFVGGEDGGFGKGAITWLAQVAISTGGIIASVLLGVNQLPAGLLATCLFIFFLNIWVAAKIHGIGIVRAFFLTLVASLLATALTYASAGAMGKTRALDKFVHWARGTKEEAQETGKPSEPAKSQPKPTFTSEKDAQAAALAKYPALGVAGSAFNKAFLEKHAKLRQDNSPLLGNPDWPMKVAEEVARELPPSQP